MESTPEAEPVQANVHVDMEPRDMNQGHSHNLSKHDRPHTTSPEIEISKSPRRPRPWSTEGIQAVLAPSPSFADSRTSKDDNHIPYNVPTTPKRPHYPPRGLSLQMPPRDISSTSTANLLKRVPLSPKLDPANSYAPAGSALPRRSRGLDFSRACTNLHHSTLAEQSSPDSSPIVGSRGGIIIPARKAVYNPANIASIPDSPGVLQNSLWSSMPAPEKNGISSSLGSAGMMEDRSGSSSSEDADMIGHDEEDFTIHMTPHVWRSANSAANMFGPALHSSPRGDNFHASSPAATKMMSFQRAQTRRRQSRKSSSSASIGSAMLTSGPSSPPPLLRSIESSLNGDAHKDPSKSEIMSRRESLSLGTCDLELSDDNRSEEEGKSYLGHQAEGLVPMPTTPGDERRHVIRRAVSRRGNLLPKSRNFSRVQATLLEEGAPVDTEVRREAEVIRQARESDAYGDLSLTASQPTTTYSSPVIQPATAGPIDGLGDIPEDITMGSDKSASRRSSSSTFTQQAMRNSAGLGFWTNYDERTRTPPPMFPRESSSGVSDDVAMDTPQSSIMSSTPQPSTIKAANRSESRSTTPQLPSGTLENLRKGNKRMRDDDFDPSFFKRRAVSPGMSLQNSPILPQSPLQRDGGFSGMQPRYGRETPVTQTVGDRISSGGSASSGSGPPPTAKKVGLQGMSDTNDGLMNMSIE
ncbi:MAG: hypothetical protein Q9202_001062 [Teloschistes flavicans]